MNKKNEQLPGIIKMVISVEIIAFVLLMIYFIFQDRGIHEMISQREEMQYTYGELQKVYREYQDSLDKNERMKQSLIQKREDQKRTGAVRSAPFFVRGQKKRGSPGNTRSDP